MVFTSAAFLESRGTSITKWSQAFSVPPSRIWDGNDGAWSTFVIRVGNPAQYFRVLPATSSDETWVPGLNQCDRGMAWCGNARGVEPFNAGTSGPASGSPNGVTLGSLDAGYTCTANKSPMCRNCVGFQGKCTSGPCPGRTCCGDVPGECNTGGCNGVSGICTGAYIGCPCPGPDYNAGSSTTPTPSAANPLNALGFLPNASTSWSDQGKHQIGPELPLDQTVQAQYGLDTVGVGPDASSGLTLDGNVVADVPAEPYYLGRLGLKPSNFSGPSQGSRSFTSQLFAQKRIPSSSFGYSAGALYRQQPVFGSLTLGGFDNARIVPNGMTFAITNFNELRVPLQAIIASETLEKNAILLSENITALVDTATPHSWLPYFVCQAFEAAFGLIWDNSTSLYLVNDSIHQQLLNNNPSVTFSFGGGLVRPINPSSPSLPVNITLPYGAFDLQAASPIYTNGTNYFPIRRAANSTQYTIGRAIFQEAYLAVDYETGNFSISQSQYPLPTKPKIITINHHLPPPSNISSTAPTQTLGHVSIAGIAIGTCAAVILICILIFFCILRRSRRRRATKSHDQQKCETKSSLGSSEPSPKEGSGPGWPDCPNIQEMSSSANSNRDLSFSVTTLSPTLVRSHAANRLEDTYLTTPFAYGKGGDGLSFKAKPLPKLPVELAGKEVASELMEKSREREKDQSPRGSRSRG